MPNVKDGTPNFSKPSLCETCSSGHMRTGEFENVTYCSRFFERLQVIRGKVYKCTDYTPKNTMPLGEMEKVALIIVKKGDTVGFVKAADYRAKNNIDKYDSLTPDTNVDHS